VSCTHAVSCIVMYCVLYCCTASKRLTLAVSDLSSIRPQLADSGTSQSKIHIRVHSSFRVQLIEYFKLIPPHDLDTDDVGECSVPSWSLLCCVCCSDWCLVFLVSCFIIEILLLTFKIGALFLLLHFYFVHFFSAKLTI